MNEALRDLYQEVIMDHSRKPRNFRIPEHINRSAEGMNPLCGDHISVHLHLKEHHIDEIGFQGAGCAICTASASLMTETVRGLDEADVQILFDKFHDLVTGHSDPLEAAEQVGKLAVFAGVSEFPIRVKCATLPWHTLRAALAGREGAVSTE